MLSEHARVFDGHPPVTRGFYISLYSGQDDYQREMRVVDRWSRVASARWDFGDGSPPAEGERVTHAYRYGTYSPSVTTEDALGNRGTWPGVVQPGVPDKIDYSYDEDPELKVWYPELTRTRFRVSKSPTPIAARRRRGTTLSYYLFNAGRVRTRILVERATKGRKAGRRCVKATRKNRRRRSCTRWRYAGSLTRENQGHGPHRVRFTGRIGKRALKPARYRFSIRARDADQPGRRSNLVRIGFRVLAG